ncbi:MAG TPA: A/G-specific adenine glycosylase, partial [Candidatus Eisenbacteria bacterium]
MPDSFTTSAPPTVSAGDFRRALLGWYRANGRPLPWRLDPSPWRVWISEMMLQQTTVATVLPRYESFLERFPTVTAMARAKVEDVLAAWSGLGYYTRARNLHAAAVRVVREHQGVFPKEPAVVRDLPGFGDYSTAAILSIVHGVPLAVVDGNVIRVVSRLAMLPGHAKSPALRKAVQIEADRLIDVEEPGDFNQAMMELGARVCTPTSPDCDGCPVEAF